MKNLTLIVTSNLILLIGCFSENTAPLVVINEKDGPTAIFVTNKMDFIEILIGIVILIIIIIAIIKFFKRKS